MAAGTRADNSRFFERSDEVLDRAVTQGLGTMLEADQLLVIASDTGRAAPVRDALQGPVSHALPASILRTHARVTLILDRQAAGTAQCERQEREKSGWTRDPNPDERRTVDPQLVGRQST